MTFCLPQIPAEEMSMTFCLPQIPAEEMSMTFSLPQIPAEEKSMTFSLPRTSPPPTQPTSRAAHGTALRTHSARRRLYSALHV
jgi:hypothetical protein